MDKRFVGTGVALVTPFFRDGNIDFTGLEKLLEHVSVGGVDYLVVMGTTAESPTLTQQEKMDVLKFVKENNSRKLPVVYGLGSNNTAELIRAYADFDEEVDAFLSASPYYNKPSQAGIQKHYEAIADKASKPIILYNVPGRTSSNISSETTLALAQHPNIIGTKEASGNIIQCTEIAADKPADFLLISGDDVLTLPLMSIGASGVISVIANALPKEFSNMVNLALTGQFDQASKIAHQMVKVNELIVQEGNPVGVKAALQTLAISTNHVRLPLVEATAALQESLSRLLK